MDEYDFEHFVGDLWERMGWETEVSQASVDAGIDVIATKETPYPQKKVIQAKRYGENTTVGGPDVQQYASLKQQVNGADSVVIVTTSSFTSSAERRAEELNVKLVDGNGLIGIIDDLNARDLVERYMPEVRREGSIGAAADGGAAVASVDADANAGTTNAGGTLWKLEQDHEWHRYFAYAVGGWFALLLLTGMLASISLLEPISSVTAIGWFGLSLALPLFWYMDMRYVRHHSRWTPTAWMYLLGGLCLPYVALPLYYYRRRKHVGL